LYTKKDVQVATILALTRLAAYPQTETAEESSSFLSAGFFVTPMSDDDEACSGEGSPFYPSALATQIHLSLAVYFATFISPVTDCRPPFP